jgi:hypothetical protein
MKLNEKTRIAIFLEPDTLSMLEGEIARLKQAGVLARATTRNQVINEAINNQITILGKM